MYAAGFFRRQHQELLTSLDTLNATLDVASLAVNPRPAYYAVLRLVSLLNVHLSIEDHALYPALMSSNNRQTRELALAFLNEMGGLSQKLEIYKYQWSTPAAIQEAPVQFIQASEEIATALRLRIEREDNELYPLLSSSGQDRVT